MKRQKRMLGITKSEWEEVLVNVIAGGIIAIGAFLLMTIGYIIRYGVPIALVILALWLIGVI